MKSKKLAGLSALLAVLMLLSACAAVPAESGAVTEAESVRSTFPVPQPDAPANAEASAAADATDSAANATESAEEFDFSNRDLSGTWDADSAVAIRLNGASVSCDSPSVAVSGSDVSITAAGTYALSGSLDNGSIIVDAGKEDKIQLVLNGVSIASDDFAAIYVKQADKVFVTLADGATNALSNGGTFRADGETDVDGVIFSKDDLTLNGAGRLTVTSPAGHGVVSKDDLAITGGTYEITASKHALSGKDGVGIADGTFTITAGKDGVHSGNDEDAQKGNIYLAGGSLTVRAADDGVTASGVLQIDGGTLDINASEGLEANYIRINDGVIKIYASDDGINAARKSGAYTPAVEINGGEIAVEAGPGDTDGIDSNGNLMITGGAIDVTGNSAFDIDGSVTFTGGTVTVNGQQVETIPNQMGGFGGFGGGRRGAQAPADGSQIPAPDGAQPPDANPGQWGGKRGANRRTPNADGGQLRKGAEPPDGTTSPTQTTASV